MAQERGSGALAVGTAVLIMVGMSMVFHCDVAEAKATDYTVEWGLKWTTKPKLHNTKAGDTVAFNYDPMHHNVVKAKRSGCIISVTEGTVYGSGDKIKLDKGENYFISSIGKDCDNGMKMIVTAN
ncbi:hypothetical protein OROHE_018808 [Orobanche hederae]